MNPGLVVKLRPAGPWRIGPDSGARNRVDAIYHSDSLYSAVTSAMSRMGSLARWLDATARAQAPAVCFSSCYPFLEDIGFVVPPRTIWPPTSPAAMSARVRWKSARFIPLSLVEAMLAGKRLNENQWSVDGPSGCLVPVGKAGPFRTSVRWNAAVDRLSGASERYSTACIEFREGCGLWTVAGFRDEQARDEWQEPVKAAFRLLADSGFGGERSRGWGRSEAPEFVEGTLPGLIVEYERREAPVAGEEAPVEGGAVAAPAPDAEAAASSVGQALSPDNTPAEPEPAADLASEAEAAAKPLPDGRGSDGFAPETEAVAEVAPVVEVMAPEAVPAAEAAPEAEAAATVVEVVAPEAGPAADAAPETEAAAPETEAVAEPAPAVEGAAPEAVPAEAALEAEVAAPETEAVAKPLPDGRGSDGFAPEPEAVAEPATVVEVMAPEAVPAAEAAPEAEAAAPETEAVAEPAVEVAAPEAEAAEPCQEATGQEACPTEAAVRASDVTEPMRVAKEREAAPAVPAAAARLQAHWLLSLFTPAAADAVDWGRGSYAVLARGGRIDSPSPGSGDLKKQIQMVAEGSVLYVDGVPLGAAADVAPDGFAHPVFRAGFALAIPLPEVH